MISEKSITADRNRSLVFLTFLLLHGSGILITALALRAAWSGWNGLQWQILQVVYGAASWFFVITMTLVFSIGLFEAARIVRRKLAGQPEQDVGLRLRVLLYVLVAWIFLNVFVFSFQIQLVSFISLVFAYGCYTLWSIRLPKRRRDSTSRIRRMIDVVCMNATLTLVIAEIALRVVAAVSPTPILVTDQSSQRNLLAAYRPPAGSAPWGFEVNRGGFYDSEFLPSSESDRQIVVSIGDSFSTGAAVPHALHFTTVCERNLQATEVYNMGFPNIGPRAYLLLLQHEARPLKPDAIVVNLFLGNDLTDGTSPQKLRWYDSDNFFVAVVWKRLKNVLSSKLRTSGATDHSERTREQLLLDYPHLGDPLLEEPTFERDLFLNIESQRAHDICIPDESKYQRFCQALDDLHRAAGDVPLAFMLIPDEFQIEDELWEAVVKQSDAKLDRFYPQQRLGKWMSSRGYPHLDLLPVLRAVPPLADGRRHVYKLQDTHFNARGNEIAGKALAEFLRTWLTGIDNPSKAATDASRSESPAAE